MLTVEHSAPGPCRRDIGYEDRATRLEMALDICGNLEKKVVLTGRDTGATADDDFVAYLLTTLNDKKLEERWKGYQKR